MFRSIIVKGLEALLTECVLGASRYSADERVFASLAETFPGINWRELADYMVGRVVVHGERRAREMEEVAATLREIDIEPIMAEAIVRRMDWSVEAGLKAALRRRSAQELPRRGGRSGQEAGWSGLKLLRLFLIVALVVSASVFVSPWISSPKPWRLSITISQPPMQECSRAGAANISCGLTTPQTFASVCWPVK